MILGSIDNYISYSYTSIFKQGCRMCGKLLDSLISRPGKTYMSTGALINDVISFHEARPRRRVFVFFVRHFATIVSTLIVLILLFSAYPFARVWTVSWVGVYLLYRHIVFGWWMPQKIKLT